MRVGNLDRKALKKFFVNGVEKSLFLGEVADGRSSAFDSLVERVKGTQEFLTAERLLYKSIYYLLNLNGDDVAAGKVRVVEDGAEDFLCQEVLD